MTSGEETLRQLVDELYDAVFVYDAGAGRAVYQSRGFEVLFARPLAEIGDNPAAWQAFVHPDDRERFAAKLPLRAGFDTEFRVVRPDGEVRWAHGRVLAMPDGRLLGLARDITAESRKSDEMEAMARQLLAIRNLQHGFIERRPAAATFEDMLDAFIRLTDSGYGFVGEVFYDGGAPYLKTHAISNIAWNDETHAMFERLGPTGFEFRNLRTLFGHVLATGRAVLSNDPAGDPRRGGLPAGHPPMHSFFGMPVYHAEEMIGMVGLANRRGGYDETLAASLQPLVATCGTLIAAHRVERDRSAAQQVRERMERQLFEADRIRAMGALAGGMAHDFNNLLMGVRGAARVVRTELEKAGRPEDEGSRQLLAEVDVACRRGAEIVDRMRGLARIDEAQRVAVNVGRVAAEAGRLFATTLAPGLQLEVEVSPELPPVVADETLLHQVVNNLLVNAAQAMEGKTGAIRLLVEPRTVSHADPSGLPMGAYVTVAVIDEGTGIHEEHLPRIFEPFFSTKKSSGMGLGLALVRSIVRRFGGEIIVQTKLGVGSVFEVMLPVSAAAAAASEAPPSGRRRFGRGERVLVVDDDALVRLTLVKQLLASGYVAEGVDSAPAALAYLLAKPVDAVMTDLVMPGVSGWDLAAAVRRENPALPLVLITGNHEAGDVPRAAAFEPVATLHKPFSSEALVAALEGLFMRRRRSPGTVPVEA